MPTLDYDDPKVEAEWLSEQYANVERYLQEQGLRHGGVTRVPSWFVAPYLSVWIVLSATSPDGAGWWAISGDLPTDYMSGQDADDARGALAALAARWTALAEQMLRGQQHPTMKVGRPEDARELGALLRSRAETLRSFADDDDLW